MTPIRRQYLKIKAVYPDAILLFRLGDFYETFDDDARRASQELDITLTSRSMGKDLRVPMAGVPAHSLDSYLGRLVKKGFQVAICEQLTDPSTSKGLVERDVVRVVSPGTVTETDLLEQDVNNYLAAVVEEGAQAGLAYVDISTGEFYASQVALDRLGLELERVSPAEVLHPKSDTPPSWLVPGVDAPSYRTMPLDPAVFDGEAAAQALLSHYGALSLESFGCESLPLATRAAGGIVDFLATRKVGRLQLANLSVYVTDGFMALDAQTRRNLNLFSAPRSDKKEDSLLGVLDLTKTPMGGRLLRQWLGRPLLDLAELTRRQEAVAWFFEDGFRRAGAVSLLDRMPDLERIVGRTNAGSVSPRELKSLQAGLETIPKLAAELSGVPPQDGDRDASPAAGAVDWLSAQLAPLPSLAGLIDQAISPDPEGEVGGGGVIRDGFSAELDELKRASRDARGFIAGLERKERERTGIKGLRVGYNQVFGYYIEVSKANMSQVPPDYVRRQTLANGERYVIPELKEYESQVLSAREGLEELERSIYRRVYRQVGDASAEIGKRASAIAHVDVFASLAEVAVRQGYVRPTLDQGNAISITAGRHPVVETVLEPGAFVPNDVSLGGNDPGVIVLTGPNMAGKSTYIRQVALITLMAQIGSFVPAAQAGIGLVDRIFTRVGLQDDLAAGQSTFMVEMVETAAILNQATCRSLVVLDEIGRGTSTYDGLAIARSVVEHLHNDRRLGCKTLFATHYHELTELAGALPGVRNFSVAVSEEAGNVVFLHRIVPGGADKSYGVHVAQLAGLPQGVISRAWEVLAGLEGRGVKPRGVPGNGSHLPEGQQIPLFHPAQPLLREIRGLDIPNMTPLEAINALYNLQREAMDQGEDLQ